MFAQLALGEEMPVRDQIRVFGRRPAYRLYRRGRHSRQGKVRGVFRRERWQWAGLLMCLVISIGLMAVTLVFTSSGHDECTGYRGPCAAQMTAHAARAVAPKAGG